MKSGTAQGSGHRVVCKTATRQNVPKIRPIRKYSKVTEEFENYLDWVAEFGKEDQEGLYLFGVHDGIQLMRDMIITS